MGYIDKKIIKLFVWGMAVIGMLCMLPAQVVEAATFNISASSTVAPNTNFTVSFGSGTTGRYSYSVSGGSIVSSSDWVEGGGSLTVKSGASGSV